MKKPKNKTEKHPVGRPPVEFPMTNVTFRISSELCEEIDRLAELDDRKRSDWLRRLVQKAVATSES